MSTWTTVEAVAEFVYSSPHATFMRRRREWFDRMTQTYQALWWVPSGTKPTVADGMGRVAQLEATGSNSDTFTFKNRFPPPEDGAH